MSEPELWVERPGFEGYAGGPAWLTFNPSWPEQERLTLVRVPFDEFARRVAELMFGPAATDEVVESVTVALRAAVGEE